MMGYAFWQLLFEVGRLLLCTPLGYTIGNRNLEADILDTEADILVTSSRP